MTDLIYRGASHQGVQTTRARMAQFLIYRGVPHDGTNSELPALSRTIAMHYRGVTYAPEPGAPLRGIAKAKGAEDHLVNGYAVA